MKRPEVLDQDVLVVSSFLPSGRSQGRAGPSAEVRFVTEVSAPEWKAVREYVADLEFWHKEVSDFVRSRIPHDQNKDQANSYLAYIGLICHLEERLAKLEGERDERR